MALTKDQRKYLEKRVEDIFEKRKEAINQRPSKPDTRTVTISLAKLLKVAPNLSNFEIAVGRDYNGGVDVTINTYDMEKHIPVEVLKKIGVTTEEEIDAMREKIDAEIDKINAEKTRVLDKLFLGDAEDALQMIKDLEAGKKI